MTNEMADKRDPQPATFHFVQQSRETSKSENAVMRWDMINATAQAGNNADGISWSVDIGKKGPKKKKKKTPAYELSRRVEMKPKLSRENHLLGARTGKDLQTVQ